MSADMRKKYGRLPGVNWGTAVIDPEDRIDVTKKYRTRSGKRVIGLQLVLHNANGEEVTFPVKGSIVYREATPKRAAGIRYCLWTLDGRSQVIYLEDIASKQGDDLVLDTTPTKTATNGKKRK